MATNGGAHRDKDSLQDQNKHVDKVKMDQNAALNTILIILDAASPHDASEQHPHLARRYTEIGDLFKSSIYDGLSPAHVSDGREQSLLPAE
jgi:hypothetical protein